MKSFSVYTKYMLYEWDDAKNDRNKKKHKIGFEAIEDFDWSTASVIDRSRAADGERRFATIGWLEGRLFTIIFTWRGDHCRVISLRRSNKNEEKFHEENA